MDIKVSTNTRTGVDRVYNLPIETFLPLPSLLFVTTPLRIGLVFVGCKALVDRALSHPDLIKQPRRRDRSLEGEDLRQ
jgi:hypothetical protein